MTQEVILHPEMVALQNQLETLRQESSKLYLQAEYMQFEERPLLLALYEKNIGKILFEEFRLGVQIRLVNLETQLFQAYINRNERPDAGPFFKSTLAEICFTIYKSYLCKACSIYVSAL